jgi:hypothetical protein
MREIERARRAGAAALGAGKPAIEAALAEIGAAFDEASAINAFKLRVERLLRLGPRHPAVHARFCARAELLRSRSLDAAIALVELWWQNERKAFQIASALGRGNRLSLEVLRDLRLILRLLRFKRMETEFFLILSELCDEPSALAAE